MLSRIPVYPLTLPITHELRTKVRLGGTYWGIYRVLGGPIKDYTTTLVRGSHDDSVELLKILNKKDYRILGPLLGNYHTFPAAP